MYANIMGVLVFIGDVVITVGQRHRLSWIVMIVGLRWLNLHRRVT